MMEPLPSSSSSSGSFTVTRYWGFVQNVSEINDAINENKTRSLACHISVYVAYLSARDYINV